jgi:hypothetical protein
VRLQAIIKKNGDHTLPQFGAGKQMAAKSVDRFMHHLITKRILEEETAINGMGFANTVLRLGREADRLRRDPSLRVMCPIREVRKAGSQGEQPNFQASESAAKAKKPRPKKQQAVDFDRPDALAFDDVFEQSMLDDPASRADGVDDYGYDDFLPEMLDSVMDSVDAGYNDHLRQALSGKLDAMAAKLGQERNQGKHHVLAKNHLSILVSYLPCSADAMTAIDDAEYGKLPQGKIDNYCADFLPIILDFVKDPSKKEWILWNERQCKERLGAYIANIQQQSEVVEDDSAGGEWKTRKTAPAPSKKRKPSVGSVPYSSNLDLDDTDDFISPMAKQAKSSFSVSPSPKGPLGRNQQTMNQFLYKSA